MQSAIDGKLEAYYACTCHVVARYSSNTSNSNTSELRKEFRPCDVLKIPEIIIRELWGSTEVTLERLLDESSPAEYDLESCQPRDTITVRECDVYVKKSFSEHDTGNVENDLPPSDTALKVIGLLMHHLAKTDKYAKGHQPNKSQIKELLLNLADEQGLDHHGLSKVHERILTDAMKYVDNHKS